MPINNSNIQNKGAFYHSLGKLLTRDTNSLGNEKYKSSHNITSSEIWMSEVPYAQTFASASGYSFGSFTSSVLMIGTPSNPSYLYPLTQTNYQTWFLDTGTPTAVTDGFIPSSSWCKPLIGSTDITDSVGNPS